MQKAKIICIVLAVVLVSAGAVALIAEMSGNANVITPPPSDTISTSMERPSDGVFDPNDAKTNLYIAHGELLRSGGFKGVNKGTSVSLGITQTVHSYRTVVGNNVFKQSVSDGFVKMGSQVYIWGDNYIFRDVDKVSGVENVTWQNTARKVSKETYDETYGYHFAALTGYILNDETILSATLEKAENGIYTYRYVLDEKVAPYYVLYEMRTNAGTKGFATFEKAEIVVEIDENWQLQTLSTDCRYNVPMLGGVPCEEHMTEVFSDFGYNGDLPEKDFFEPYLDAEISEPIVKEPTVANRLLDMFEPYLTGNDLNVALKVSKGGSELVNAKVRATIDINNLDKITADVLVGEELYLSYAQGKLLVDYQDFKGSVEVEDVLSLVSSVVAPSQDGEKISLDADKLLEAASFAADGSTCSVNLPLALSQDITAIVNIYGKADGESYVFTKADVQIDDISVDVELCQGFDVPEHSGEYPDVLGLLDVISGNVISVNASFGDIKADVAYDLAANKLVATAGDLTACMQNETVYVALGEVKLKVALSDLKILVSLLGDAFGNLSSALPSMPQLPQTAEEIVALISDVTATATENGVAFNLVLDGINASVELTANDGKWNLQAATVAIGNSTLTLTPSSASVTFPQIDDEQYVDVTKLAFSYVSPITALLKAENYGAEFDVDVTVGGNTYDVIGSVLFGKNGDVNVNANVSMGGKLLAKADVAYVNGALYLNVNGVKLALNTASLPQANLAKILGVLQQNDDVANVISEITTVADKFANFDLATLDISKLVTKFSFVDQKLTVGINASEFGLGEFEVNVYATGAKLAAEVHGLELAGIALDLSAKAYASKTAVTVPDVNDYITELKVEALGYTAYVSANLYDMSVSASVKDVFGADLDLLYQGGTVYAVYGAVKVKLNVSDIDKLLAIVSELSGGKAIEMPSFNVDFNDILNGLSAVLDGEGYSVSAIIGAITANAVFDGNAQLTKATVQVSGTEITVSTVENADVTPVDVNDKFVDIAELADCCVAPVANLLKAENYGGEFSLAVTVGGNTYDIYGSVLLGKDGKVNANARMSLGKKLLAVADITYADNVIYLNVNGLKAALDFTVLPEIDLQQILAFLRQSDTLAEVVDETEVVVSNFISYDWKLLKVNEILTKFAFANGKLTLGIDASEFGLNAVEIGVYSANGKLAAEVKGLELAGITFDVSVNAYASDAAVTVPDVSDYLTELKVEALGYTAYVSADLSKLTASVSVQNLFGANLDLLYKDGVVYAVYGAVKVKLNVSDIDGLLAAISKFNGGKVIEMPQINADLNSVLKGLSAVLDGEGYSVSAIIDAITANAVFDENAQLTEATVKVSGTEITVSTVECANVTPVNVNDEFVDVAALVDFVADDVAALIDANGYKASLQGDFTFGAEKFGVIANVNYNDGLLVDAQIYHNGVKIIVAQVRFVDDVLFADVNGIRAAVNVGGASAQSNASLQETLSKFLGYNAYVDKLINLVINVVGNFDFNSIGGLLGGLTFDGDRAVVTVNGGAFGLSTFTCGIAKGLNVSVGGLCYDDVKVDVTSATVAASNEQIARPDVNEYQTNIQIAVDEKNTIYANLDLINNVFMLRLDDLNVKYENGVIKLYFFNKENNSAVQLKVNFANLQDIIDKFNNIAGDNAQLDGDMLSAFADIDIKAIVNSLTLSSDVEAKTSTVGVTFAGINAEVKFFGGEAPTLQAQLPVKQLNKTFIVSADEQRVYHDYSFDNESDYVAIEDVINDYYDVLEGLVKDNKAWYFTLQATLIDNAKGITYTVNDGSFAEFVYVKGNDEHATEVSLRAKLDISKTAKGKTSKIAIEIAMFGGRVYFNYNGLKISVALDAIKGCITDKPQEDFITAITNCVNDIVSTEPANPNSLINRLTAVVPQIKDAIVKAMEAKNDLANLNVVRYQDIIKLFSYNRDTHDLDVVINGGIFLQDLCDQVALSVNKQNGYLHLANLSLGYGKDGNGGFNTVIDNVSALVMPKTLQQATEEITSYDAANHINLDSIKELLTAFVNTATPIEGTNHRSFHINGTVNAKVLASDLPMGLDLFVDIDEVNDVFIAVRLDRGVSEEGSTMFYQDYGGYSYLYYDGSLDKADMPEATPFRVARDSLYNYCTKCGKYKASSVHGHYEFPVVKYYNEKRFESAVNGADGLDYDKTFTTQQFVDGILANIIDMFNFSSLIADNIKKIEISNTEVQIEKLIKNYTYADSSFNLDLDLSSMVSNSSASVKIVHDGNLELTKLGGNASIFGLVKASFDLNLVDSTYGVATEYVHARTLWK